MKHIMNSAVCLLEKAADSFGNKTAFEDQNEIISFNSLREKSRIVGSELIKYVKTGRENPIIVLLPKGINSIISFMGIMYSGSPYAPINYVSPLERMKKIIGTLRPSAIITDSEGKERLAGLETDIKVLLFDELVEGKCDNSSVDKALASVCDLDAAYIMHTSGSTGVPKGVTFSCRGVIDYAEWIAETFGINDSDILGLNSPFHFDNSIFDIYTTLYTGAKTIIIPEILFMYPDQLMAYVAEKEISCIFWVPTVMISVANSGILETIKLPKLKNILFAGEVMPNKQLNIWRKAFPDCTYTNLYGPTETNVCTYYIVDRPFEDNESLPIGLPCGNMRAVILNEDNKQCARGETGELCISTAGRSLGYWNAPELSEKVFIQNPVNNNFYDRIYRTGDLAYENEDGNLIFLGRKDTQIKLRGNRIELGDIESAAAVIDNVESVCALFDADKQEIVLFIETTAEIAPRKFKMELKNYVPSYMVPSRIVTMEKFPHTASGKIDRVGLRKKFIG